MIDSRKTAVEKQQEFGDVLGLTAAICVFIASGLVTYFNTSTLSRDAWWVSNTHEVIATLEDLLSVAKGAETGQRGFLITNDEKYLGHYHSAITRIDERVSEIQHLTQDNQVQQDRIPALRSRVSALLQRLENVIEFTPSGGRVDVRTTVIPEREIAIMTVEDNGVGMDARIQSRLFQAFNQGDQTLDRAKGGLGLGLVLVKGLIELHGGSVSAKSDGPGTGSLFTLRLPLSARGTATVPRS